MTSTVSRSPAEAASNPTIFSYAQAAKGRTPSTIVSAAQSSQATSGVNTPSKDPNSSINTPLASVNGTGGSDGGDRSVNGSYDVVSRSDPLGVGLGQDSESKSNMPVNVSSSPSSPSFGTASTSTLPKEDGLTLATSTASETVWDRHPSAVAVPDKPSEVTEVRRGKKGKKNKTVEKEAEKEKEELKSEILVAAPPPAVNFWLQRKEEQAAKAKSSPPIVQSSQTFSENSASYDAAQGAKSVNIKRRGKSSGIEEGDRCLGALQNGSAKEPSNMNKGQKKGSDGISRPKEDSSTKKASARGSRMGEKDEKTLADQLPPPVEDAISWPTPEIALEEEKRKAQEKGEKEEKDDATSNKPRTKEKWVPVPYIPTVTFNTPLPVRGARGRGGGRGGRDAGGRGGHAPNGSISGEKTLNVSTATTNSRTETRERGRDNVSAGRAASLPPNSTKRPSSDGSYGTRDQRKPSGAATTEKSKVGPASVSTKGDSGSAAEARRTSTSTQTDLTSDNHQNNHSARGDTSKGLKSDQAPQGAVSESNSHPRSGAADRRSEPNLRAADNFKDNANFNKDNNHQPRDRADGRSERGRGGFRGRGGHNTFPNGQQHPQHAFTNGQGPQPPNGFQVRSNTGPYSPPLQQSSYSNPYAQASSRGGRGGSRSQSIPNNAMYTRFPPNGNSGSQQIAPLQTSTPMFDYQPIQSMSAVPYNPYIDQYSVLAMVTMQLEYYFSIDNLCKDVYLRKHMDSQGFVFLTFIAGFKRIQALTQDFELLRFACQESDVIDIIRGEDGIDRLRRQEGWEKWVLAMEERDESTRNAGPVYHHRQQPHQKPQHVGPQVILPGHQAISPSAFSPNSTESSFRPYAPTAPVANGNDYSYQPETPLSAAVPDFSPGLLPLNGTPDPLESETTFTDDEVDNLTLVFNVAKGNGESKPKVPFHNASSRTFSNGSIDGRSIAEEMHDDHRQGRALTNGSHTPETSPESLRRSRSPFAPLSPTKAVFGNAPPVMWVKGQKQQAPISEHNTEEQYNAVRSRALKHRELSPPGETHPDMKTLYEFWSHFLCRNFNPRMYTEFRKYAFEDVTLKKSMVGMSNLIAYYDEILNSKKKTIPEPLAQHYVQLVKSEESNTERPGFGKLRAAWRNGALDMKSRKKIDNFVDPKLRRELER